MTKEQLIDEVIWSAVMEGTAYCGWTDKARLGLIKEVRDSVKWAMSEQGEQYLKFHAKEKDEPTKAD